VWVSCGGMVKVLNNERSQMYGPEALNESTKCSGKFLRNQFTYQNNGGRSSNQNHSKRKHTLLTWKPEVGKITEREENSPITMAITGGLI